MRRLNEIGRERDTFVLNPLFLATVAVMLLVFMYYLSA